MKLNKLFNKAKKTVDDRGGIESLKADARELKDIAGRKGSVKDRAKDAATAIKDPGAPGGERTGTPSGDQSRKQS
jgi:hypothetical protein